MLDLQKYSERLEQQRQEERTMRIKLQEEYAQNAKNHEEEVQLRLKFEQKLNAMHAKNRDLTTKLERATKDLNIANELKEMQSKQIDELQVNLTE